MGQHKMKRLFRATLIALAILWAAIIVVFFPWSTDKEPSAKDTEAQRAFYTKAYATEVRSVGNEQADYAKEATGLHVSQKTKPRLIKFIEDQHLNQGRALEVGSGVGFFQDVIENYTGLDISPSVARLYKKRFVLGSATAMPFQDSDFDLVFSFYVTEHVPNPEQALREMRRVTKSGGYIYLEPGWNCNRFLSQGYAVRPYSDFGLKGKFLKAVEPIVDSSPFRASYVIPVRLMRAAVSQFGPTTLHYTRLSPNYERYWMADSDAVNSLDRAEFTNWFTSRGDECLNCDNAIKASFTRASERWLIIRVHK